ncbi:MAG TPA: DUF1294 domain-containing protein [Microscillaceae bacterium]|nr:DUF1294 domain-containing protein [Microscillaceae bacterium]
MLLIYYLIFINILAAFVFRQDKGLAKRKQKRVSEKRLHTFELAGGVFSIVILMFTIRHKNRKFSYFVWTFLILAGWLALLYFWKFHLKML